MITHCHSSQLQINTYFYYYYYYVLDCWQSDPRRRPSATQVVERLQTILENSFSHPFTIGSVGLVPSDVFPVLELYYANQMRDSTARTTGAIGEGMIQNDAQVELQARRVEDTFAVSFQFFFMHNMSIAAVFRFIQLFMFVLFFVCLC